MAVIDHYLKTILINNSITGYLTAYKKLFLVELLASIVFSFYNAFFTKCYGNYGIQFSFKELETALQFSETSKLFLFHKIKPQLFEDEREDMRLECSSEEPGFQENQTVGMGLFKGTSVSVTVTSTRLFSFLSSVSLCLSHSLILITNSVLEQGNLSQ